MLPIFKSSVHKHEEMMFYSEYTSAVLYDFEDPDINPYTISEFSSNGEIITQLEKKIRALKNIKQASEIKDFMKLKDLSDVSILLIENYDFGQKSPFTIERINIYLLKPGESSFEQISEGICHYN